MVFIIELREGVTGGEKQGPQRNQTCLTLVIVGRCCGLVQHESAGVHLVSMRILGDNDGVTNGEKKEKLLR